MKHALEGPCILCLQTLLKTVNLVSQRQSLHESPSIFNIQFQKDRKNLSQHTLDLFRLAGNLNPIYELNFVK